MICQDRRMEMDNLTEERLIELDETLTKDYIENDIKNTEEMVEMQQKREMKAKYKKIAMVAGATVIAAGGLYLLDRMRKSDTFAYDPVEDAIKDVTPVDGEFDE